MGSGLPGSLPSYILYHAICIFLLWLIKLLLLHGYRIDAAQNSNIAIYNLSVSSAFWRINVFINI